MAFRSTTHTLASDVSDGGSFSVNYPSGTTSGSFLANGHQLSHSAFAPTVLNSPLGFEATFDDDVIVVRYRGVTTMPQGSVATLKLALQSTESDDVDLSGYATSAALDAAVAPLATSASLILVANRVTLLENSALTTFVQLSDVPSAYAGEAGKVLAVKQDETGLEFASVSSGGGGTGAPTDVDYLVRTASLDLSAERVVTDTTYVTWDWDTAGQAKATVSSSLQSWHAKTAPSGAAVGTSDSQTLTNKTIAAGDNTISGLATSMFAANVVDTDTSLTANSDTRLASQKAIKAYVVAAVAAAGGALTGEIKIWPGASAPSGYVFCYGQELSRATYAGLDAVLGETWGDYTDGSGGEGTTHFRVPDLRGRVVAGRDDMGGSAANRLTGQSGGCDGDLGNVGGLETHTLTVNQMPSHSHSLNAYTAGNAVQPGFSNIRNNNTQLTTNSAGGDQAHNNVQPTAVVNFIIKT